MVVVPIATPVTAPATTVAIPVDTDVQEPPGATSAKEVTAPTQTTGVPVMVPATGNGLTVTMVDATAVPQLLVTV